MRDALFHTSGGSANIAAHHVMTFEASRFLGRSCPWGRIFRTPSSIFLEASAPPLLNFAILLMLAGLLYAAIRRSVPPAAAYFAGSFPYDADGPIGHGVALCRKSAGRSAVA